MKLQESGENYLETILILENKNGYVRSIDIANTLNFSKPSVSRAVKVLKENNYIKIIKIIPVNYKKGYEITIVKDCYF